MYTPEQFDHEIAFLERMRMYTAASMLRWCAERMRVTDAQIREVIDELKSRESWSAEEADEFCREQAHKLERALTTQQAASAEPVAWIRAHRSHTDSGVDYDEEVVAGSDMPTGTGWLPLYAALPPSVPDEIDLEAVAWAYRKLTAFGCQNNTDGALMCDRLNLMLLSASPRPTP